MYKTFLFIIFICPLFFTLQAQDHQSEASIQVMLPEVQDMELLSNWSTGSREFNDIWGYVDSQGKEVAIIGSQSHFYFVDIADPNNPELIDGFAGGSVTIWRDMKTYGQWAYGVCDNCTEGLSIFKLGDSPSSNGVEFVRQDASHFGRAHNIFIDELNGRLYAVGTNSRAGGVIIFDIKTNPEFPILLASVNLPGGYIHDIYVRNHIGYANSGSNGLYVYNFSTPTNPQALGSMTSYQQQGYNHSSWLNDAGDVLIMADETHNTSIKAVDVSDLSDIGVTSLFRSELLAPAVTGSIAHNPFVRDNYAIISYYHDGVQIFDISNPSNVQQVAWYDTYTNNTNYGGYDGCWGVYPYLPSGNIIGSDGTGGLFVLRPTQINFSPIPPVQPPFAFLDEPVDPCVAAGTPVTMELVTDADVIQWYRNGAQVGFSETYTATSEGTYSAVVYKGPHSFTLDPIEIVYGQLPDVTLNVGSEINICEDEVIDLFVAAGADTYEWFLNGSSIATEGNVFTASESGEYTVVATSGACEATSSPVNINVNSFPETIFNVPNEIAICEGEELDLEIAAGADTYEWFLNGSSIATEGNIFAASEPGVYTVVATSGVCEASSESVDLTVVALPDAILDQTNMTLCEGELTTLSTSSNGESYQWFTGFDTPVDGATGTQISVGQAGQYRVEVANGDCTTSSDWITVDFVVEPEIELNVDQEFIICEGETAMLSVLNSPDDYQTFNVIFSSASQVIQQGSNPSLEVSEPGQLEVTLITDYCTSITLVNIQQTDQPQSSINSPENVICEGENILLTANEETSAYQWLLDGQVITGATSSSYEAAVSGNYTLEQSNDFCSDISAPFTLDVVMTPLVSYGSDDAVSLCLGETATLAMEGEADSYVWTDPNGVIVGTNSSLIITDNNTSGTYGGLAANGDCFSTELFFTVEFQSTAELDIQASDLIICAGENTTLIAQSDTDNFVWLRNGDVIAQNQNVLDVDTPSSYAIQTSGAECFSTSPAYIVIAGEQPNTFIQTPPNLNLCQGDSYTLEAMLGAASYSWYQNGNPLGITSSSFTVNTSGIYSVQVSSADGCTSFSQEFAFNFTTLPNATLDAPSQQTICEGESISLQAPQSADAYTWTLNNNFLSSEPNIIATQAGTYQLLLNSNNCSSFSQEINLNVTNNPIINFQIDDEIILCAGETYATNFDFQLDAYQWFKDGQAFSTDSNIEITEAGSYSLTGTLAGCNSSSDMLIVNVRDLPSVPLSVDGATNLCEGDMSLLLASPDGQSYQWFRNGQVLSEESSQLTVDQPGIYSYTISDGDCTNSSEEIQITVAELPLAEIEGEEQQNYCEGELVTLTSPSNADDLVWSSLDDSSFTASGASVQITESGTYILTTAIGDCVSIPVSVQIDFIALPDVELISEDIILCEGESVEVVAPEGANSYNWFKDGALFLEGASQIEIAESGMYSLVVETGDCSATSNTFEVSVVNLPGFNGNDYADITICEQETYNLTVPTGITDFTWFRNGQVFNTTDETIMIDQAGTYQLEIASESCSARSPMIDVTINTLPSLDDLPSEIKLCAGEVATINAPANMDDYLWIKDGNVVIGASGPQFETAEAGSYQVEITLDGCTKLSPIIKVEINSLPSLEYFENEILLCEGEVATLDAPLGMDQYIWTKDGKVLTADESSLEVTSAGNYQLEIIFESCSETSTDILISYEIVEASILGPDDSIIFCQGSTIGLVAETNDADSIFWFLDGVLIETSTSILEVTESGSYTMFAVKGDCASEEDVVEIFFQPNPEFQVLNTNFGFCNGESTTIGVVGSDLYNYSWTYEAFTSNEAQIEITEAGTYVVNVTDINTGCQSTDSVQVFHFEPTIPTISTNGPELTASSATAYQWFLDGQPIPDANNDMYTASISGAYQVETIDDNGCTAISEIIEITISSTQNISGVLQTDLFPNPTSSKLFLTLTTDRAMTIAMDIYNQLGQLVWHAGMQALNSNNITIPTTALSPGVYYLRLQNAEGEQQTMKFIKQQ